VVYAFVPAANLAISIDLCTSLYDTKIYVYQDTYTPGNPYACNDDAGCGYSGWQSRIDNCPMQADHSYYIVIDGYLGDCGTYSLEIPDGGCVIICPPEWLPEGEPPLVANYDDHYNGGCNSTPNVFQTLEADAAGHLDLCGRSGTYDYFGSAYRDTDWFIVTAGGPTVTYSLTPEFAMYGFLLGPESCASVGVLQQIAPVSCETQTMTIDTHAGDQLWLWAGPTVFAGLPEFTYYAELSGLAPGGATAVASSTWGAIKSMYK